MLQPAIEACAPKATDGWEPAAHLQCLNILWTDEPQNCSKAQPIPHFYLFYIQHTMVSLLPPTLQTQWEPSRICFERDQCPKKQVLSTCSRTSGASTSQLMGHQSSPFYTWGD